MAITRSTFLGPNAGPGDIDDLGETALEPFGEAPVESIAQRFAKVANRNPTQIAIDDGVVRLSYAEMLLRVRQLAARVGAAVPPGRPVAIVLPNAAELPIAALSCFAAGRPYVPIDLDYPAARNIEILREVRPAAAIALPHDACAAALLPAGLPRVDASLGTDATEAPPFPVVDVDAPAVILYTSGSTGRPKGICNAQNAILHRVVSFTELCQFDVDDRFMVLSSPCTIAGLYVPLTAWLSGATVRVAELRRVGLDGVRRILRDESISVYWSVPAVLRALLTGPDGREAMRSLRLVRLGGDLLLEPDLVGFLEVLPGECRILNGFGSTEVPTTFAWYVRPGLAEAGFVPSGYPVPGIDFELVDKDGLAVPHGEVGELVVRSRYSALGLWQDGRLTPGPFQPDPIDLRRRTLATGDLMRLRPDGMTVAFGRKDRQVKIRGTRVDPGEIEAALRGCPNVTDAAVIAPTDGAAETSLVGFVVLAPGSALASADFRAALATHLPAVKVPSLIHVVDAIPRLPGFKPDLGALVDLHGRRRDAADRAEPASPPGGSAIGLGVDAAVGTAWAAVLGHRAMIRERSWEEAGGDSLKSLQLLLQIEQELGCTLPTEILASGMTPSSLRVAVEHCLAARPDDTDLADDRRQTVFMMPGIYGNELGLAQFRYSLREQVRIEVIDYADWCETIAYNGDFGAIVDAVVTRIQGQGDDGELYLAGHSLGGFVAFAAAQRLVEQGRRVAFLGLLDARVRSPSRLSRAHWLIVRGIAAIAQLREGRGAIMRWSFRLFVEFGAYRMLAAFAWASMALAGPRRADAMRLQLLVVLRTDALRRWLPKPTDIPTVLFRSAADEPGLPRDYGWSALCEHFRVVSVGGDHASMLTDASGRERLSAAFLEAFNSATRQSALETRPLPADQPMCQGLMPAAPPAIG